MVYNSVMFCNEFELLEIRLEELWNVVDRFIIVEATKTHSDLPKLLHYLANEGAFARYREKISHVIVDDLPSGHDWVKIEGSDVRPGIGWIDEAAWRRERHQRAAGIRGMPDLKLEDVVIVTDADEIPEADSIPSFIEGDTVCRFRMAQYFGCLNRLGIDQNGWIWIHGMTNGAMVLQNGLDWVKQTHVGYHNIKNINDGGWHFSWMGGHDRAMSKLRAFAHRELTQEWMDSLLSDGEVVSVDERFPKYLCENTDRFRHMLCS